MSKNPTPPAKRSNKLGLADRIMPEHADLLPTLTRDEQVSQLEIAREVMVRRRRALRKLAD